MREGEEVEIPVDQGGEAGERTVDVQGFVRFGARTPRTDDSVWLGTSAMGDGEDEKPGAEIAIRPRSGLLFHFIHLVSFSTHDPGR